MSKALTPEVLDVTNIYIQCGMSLQETSEQTGLDLKAVADIIAHPQSKQFIREVYLDSGYRNNAKIGALLDKMIESKIEEAEETEMYTEMDLADLLKLAHKIRMDEAKLDSPNTQVNIANFGDSNYGNLVEKLLHGNSNK